MFIVTPEVSVRPLSPELLGASIDLPRSGSQSNAYSLTVAGWAVGRDVSVREIHLLSDARLVRTVRLTEERSDVARYLNEAPGSLRSGFITILDTTVGIGANVEVRAVLSSGREIPVGEISLARSWLSGTHPAERGVVSVVIPCFNQAHFLSDAIESCLRQTYPNIEVVVVDDGSSDNTQEVASRYRVRYVRQDNGGLAAARNTGIRRSNGEYITFMDADDRLAPDGIRLNLDVLRASDACAFVSGEHCYIGVDGARTGEWDRPLVEQDHYEALLRTNYIGCPACVTYRRSVFNLVGAFDAELNPCEDYDLYLRIARRFPVAAHKALVAEYRRYGSAMSDDSSAMLKAVKEVLQRQRPWVRGSSKRRAALREGHRFWQGRYGTAVAATARQDLRTPGYRYRGVAGLVALARHSRRHLVSVIVGANGPFR